MGKVKFSSPEPTGAIISQFYLALEICFEMKNEEVVLIERDGDVSKNNFLNKGEGIQLELKEYADDDDLTDSHLNFWNTLNNWLNEGFDSSKYKYLILTTTQDYGAKTSLSRWNASKKDERIDILKDIHEKAKKRFLEAKLKDTKATESDSLKLMNKVFSIPSSVENIIDKVIIDSNRTRRDGIVNELKEKHLQFILDENKENAINALLGYIMNEEQYNKGWEISYNGFSIQLQDLSARFNNQSPIFPLDENLKTIPDTEKENKLKYAFVKKIEEIEYQDAIPTSLNNYWFTINTIAKEFSSRKQKMTTLKQFQDDLIINHNFTYSKYSRSCSQEELINKSQDFYDDIFSGQTPNFDVYNNTPLIFKNGMYHLLANEDDKIVWKLNPKTNE